MAPSNLEVSMAPSNLEVSLAVLLSA